MGIISSKFLKQETKPTKATAAIQTETPRQTTQIPDVRSPTADIERTPILVDKLTEIETPREHRSLSLRNRLLKSLKLDPRSPTIGIYRTPILIEDSPTTKTNQNNMNSPVSIYSCNLSDSLVEDVMTPIEPSVNVSGFEFPKEIYCDEFDVTLSDVEMKENGENKSCLKVSEKPNTDEAKKLLEEIISDEEYVLKKVKIPSRKTKGSSIKNSAKSACETKGKFRPPLSNITSSTNSPSNVTIGIKSYNRNKVVPECGSENSASPNIRQLAQWDQNNTVFI